MFTVDKMRSKKYLKMIEFRLGVHREHKFIQLKSFVEDAKIFIGTQC